MACRTRYLGYEMPLESFAAMFEMLAISDSAYIKRRTFTVMKSAAST